MFLKSMGIIVGIKMNFKLACRNILNNFREYKIYFFTIILSVSVFYVFNSIESQKLMMNYKFNNNDILSFVEGYLEKASFLVSIIIGFLLIYANNFLIKRRKKEIKIYSIIGMKKYQICSLIFIETFIIGVISLVFGLIIGVLLSQGLSIIKSAPASSSCFFKTPGSGDEKRTPAALYPKADFFAAIMSSGISPI